MSILCIGLQEWYYIATCFIFLPGYIMWYLSFLHFFASKTRSVAEFILRLVYFVFPYILGCHKNDTTHQRAVIQRAVSDSLGVTKRVGRWYTLGCFTAADQQSNWVFLQVYILHYNDVIRGAMASQITSLTSVHSTVYSRRRSKKHQSSALLAFVRGIHRWPVNCLHKGPVTWKMFPFDDAIMVHWYTAVPVCSPWYSRQTLHGSQMRSNYWISFVSPKSYLCIAFVSVLLYEISGYILDSVITELCYIMK